MNTFRNVSFLLLTTIFASVVWADETLLKIKPFIRQHCVECHGPDKQKGEILKDLGAVGA